MRNIASRKVSIEELERMLKVAADVVALHGETYLPIFKRLHDELLKAREAEKIKKLAMEIALQYATL
jgi:hypothetical protein